MTRALLLVPLLAFAAAVTAAETGLEAPESIVQDVETGFIYCSNLGAGAEAPTAKDGNGFISKLGSDGSVEVLRFLPQAGEPALNSPKGLAVIGSLLWVADIDRVVGFDLETGKQLQSYDLAEAKVAFANDLCEADGTLLCSDTKGDQVLALTGADRGAITAIEVLGAKLFGGANGLAYTSKGQVAIASFPINDPANGAGAVRLLTVGEEMAKNAKLPFPAGLWDGVAEGRDGTVYASDWRSKGLWAVKPGGQAEQIAKDLEGPADFCLLKDGSAILVPEMMANRVTRVALAK